MVRGKRYIGHTFALSCLLLLVGCAAHQPVVAPAQDIHQSISKESFERSLGARAIGGLAREAILKTCDEKDSRKNASRYERERTVRIIAAFGSGQIVGTGILVSDTCVVTAGHVIFNKHPDKNKLAFADSVTVEFGGQSQASVKMFTVAGWVTGLDECDYGSIILPAAFRNAKLFPIGDDEQQGPVVAGGYPRQKNDMLVHDGAVTKREGLLLRYVEVESEKGQSGGPVFRPGGHAIAIHCESVCNGTTAINKGVRISGRVKENITQWATNK